MKASKQIGLALLGIVGMAASFLAGDLMMRDDAPPHDEPAVTNLNAAGAPIASDKPSAVSKFPAIPVQPNIRPAAPGEVPLVYALENTATGFPVPAFPALENAPAIAPLPDPFAWAKDPLGKDRSTAFKDWERHRAEMLAMFQKYEIGIKPDVDPAKQVTATFTPTPSGGTLVVTVRVKDQSFSMTCPVAIPPTAKAPYPILIGIGSGSGSLPANNFTARGIATVTYNNNALTQDGRPSATDAFYRLYPEQMFSSATVKGDTGQFAAWIWGASRVIDGLALVRDVFPIDMNHIAITGCSRNGKLALFAGAFDERIALTIAQESGGGGATSWRYSATEKPDAAGKLPVEGISNTDHSWFASQMFTWAGETLPRLPMDHHMLCALCAPRALYITSNTDYTWLSNPSCYVNSLATQKIYATLGIADRFGFAIDGGHGHCQVPASELPDLAYFLDRFMLGQPALSMTVVTSPPNYAATIDAERWTRWWGTGKPELPP